jgi:hypothetical protein
MTPTAIAAELAAAIQEGLELFQDADEADTAVHPRPGGWCAREILGHLVDSACNNHRRFIVGRGDSPVVFQGYDGDAWVARQRYVDRPFSDIASLWEAYNRHLVHVIAGTPSDALGQSGAGPEGGDVTLGFLMEDYVRHLRHHLAQLRALLTT